MAKPRIALFDDWLVMKWNHPGPEVEEDEPGDWAAALAAPKLKPNGMVDSSGPLYVLSDPRALSEIARVLRYRTCAICRGPMRMRETWIEDESVYVCCACGYWAGVGFREWNYNFHLHPLRATIGRYQRLKPLDSASTEYLMTHLRRAPKDLGSLSPHRAEKFVVDLIAEVLGCEVRPVGGPNDGGVDGYVLHSDEVRSIVQVKWRQDMDKAESVTVVRDVGGTLLSKGVPDGIIVSNRDHFSASAVKTAGEIEGRRVDGVGVLRLQLADYHTIVDMLEFATAHLTEAMKPDDWFPVEWHEDNCVFDGAAAIPTPVAREWGSVP